MPKKPIASLPESLRYLEPVVQKLGGLKPDELNEDLDCADLEKVLRERIRAMDPLDAQEALSGDRSTLSDWLKKDAPVNHCAYWILGALSSPDLVEGLLREPSPPTLSEPVICFNAPAGWKVERHPLVLNFKGGKLQGGIQVVEKSYLEHLQQTRMRTPISRPVFPANSPIKMPEIKATRTVTEVTFNHSFGTKSVYAQTAPAPFKSVEYFLTVPGGYTMIVIFSKREFDEAILEQQLSTLRID